MEHRLRTVIDALEREWPAVATSAHAQCSLRQWQSSEPILAPWPTVGDVVRAAHEADRDVSVGVVRALMRQSANDELARRALLQVMIPVMCRRVQWLRRFARSMGIRLELDEATQTVVSTMVEVIARVAGRDVAWPISYLRSKLRRALFGAADREARYQLNARELDLLHHPAAAESSLPELEDVLLRAARSGCVSSQDAALIWMTRVGGWSVGELTERFGATHKTLLKRRERAERTVGRVA